LEAALDPVLLAKMREEVEAEDGSQYPPRMIEFPSRLHVLKQIQKEEAERQDLALLGNKNHGRSACLTGSVGINMGLDLEMRQ